MKISYVLLLFLLSIQVLEEAQAVGASNTRYDWLSLGGPILGVNRTQPDWLNPFGAGRPEWDPYGPGSPYAVPGRPVWDPYAPFGYDLFVLEEADPTKEGLTLQTNLRSVHQLYFQDARGLTVGGSVALGGPFILWAKVGAPGDFLLYDYGRLVLARSYLATGWYRITGAFAEVLGTHNYRFISAGFSSNNIMVIVAPGGYPTLYSLTGRVVDQFGQGIPGVMVTITNTEGGTFTKTTDLLGYYGMDVPSGNYIIYAQREGYRFTPSTARVWMGTVSAARTIVGFPAS
jgi:hypothetical protein